jgi:prophage regulatory protein
MPKKFLRLGDVVQLCGLPRSTIYEKMAARKFPLQVRLSARAVGWLEEEILAWQNARIAERDSKREAARSTMDTQRNSPGGGGSEREPVSGEKRDITEARRAAKAALRRRAA